MNRTKLAIHTGAQEITRQFKIACILIIINQPNESTLWEIEIAKTIAGNMHTTNYL